MDVSYRVRRNQITICERGRGVTKCAPTPVETRGKGVSEVDWKKYMYIYTFLKVDLPEICQKTTFTT